MKKSSSSMSGPEHQDVNLKQISRNTLFLIAGQITSKIISFGYFLVLTRCFTVAEFGNLSLVFSLLLLADTVSESGLNRLVIREIGRDEQQLKFYFGLLTPLKFALCLLSYAILCIVGWTSYSPEVLRLVIIGGLSLLPMGLGGLFNAFLHARQLMIFSSIGEILLSVSQAALGLGAMLIEVRPEMILGAYFLSSFIYMSFLGSRLYRIDRRLQLLFDFSKMWHLLANALPYAGIGILMTLSLRAEILVLSWFATDIEVGLYSVATKFPEAAIFIPLMLASSISPVLAKVHEKSTAQLREIYLWAMQRIVKWLLPFSIAVILASDKIISLLFAPEYMDSAIILKILFFAFPFLSLQMLNSSVLLTSSYPRNTLLLFIVTTAMQFVLGMLLVTRFGAIGAALSFLCSHIVTYLVSYHHIRKWFMQQGGGLRNILRPVIAGLLMSLVTFVGQDVLDIWIVPVALSVYLMCILILPETRFTDANLVSE